MLSLTQIFVQYFWIFVIHSQVEVQTQIDFWSDPVERTPVCSQTEIIWFFGSSSALRSDHGLEMVWSEVILVWKVWS